MFVSLYKYYDKIKALQHEICLVLHVLPSTQCVNLENNQTQSAAWFFPIIKNCFLRRKEPGNILYTYCHILKAVWKNISHVLEFPNLNNNMHGINLKGKRYFIQYTILYHIYEI
jgi:hypothetical protein